METQNRLEVNILIKTNSFSDSNETVEPQYPATTNANNLICKTKHKTW